MEYVRRCTLNTVDIFTDLWSNLVTSRFISAIVNRINPGLTDFSEYYLQDVKRYVPTEAGIFRSLVAIIANRGLFAIVAHRLQHRIHTRYARQNRKAAFLLSLWAIIVKHLGAIWGGAYICQKTPIEGDLYLSSKGGIVLGARHIGRGGVIQQKVTIGRNIFTRGKPTIGNKVWIGQNSVVSGDVSIGNGATILENSVLTKNIPANCLVGGNPARVIRKNFNNSKLLANPMAASETVLKVSKGDDHV
jgi:serine O-acetyltransferase